MLTFCSTTLHFSPVLCASGAHISLRRLMYSLAMISSLRLSQSSAPLRSISRSWRFRHALGVLDGK